MKYKTVTVKTDHLSAELVSQAMFDAGAEGVSVLDRQDFDDLVKSDVIWDYIDSSATATDDVVTVSTQLAADDGGFEGRLKAELDAMVSTGGVRYFSIATGEADDADWENEWKKYYKPIKTKNITVVPSWIDYKPEAGEKIMRLDPGAAFGTGEHATTKMCLDLMAVEGKSVIDVGCGSGILGIAAKIAGATDVYMCDIDEQAVDAARRNAEFNGVDVTVERADLIEGSRRADYVFANLTADILMRLSDGLKEHFNEGAKAVLSGIIVERADEVENCFRQKGYKILQRATMDGWRALVISAQ